MLPGEYDDTRARVLGIGLEALHHIKGDDAWRCWLFVMDAVALLTNEVCAEYGATWEQGLRIKPCAKEIIVRIDAWERSDPRDANRPTLSKQERHALRELYKHREIIIWRDNQVEYKKRRLNHPCVVMREYRVATRDPPPAIRKNVKVRETDLDRMEEGLKAAKTELAAARKERDEFKSDAEWKSPENITLAEDALYRLLQYRPIQEKLAVMKRLLKRLGIAFVRLADR
jgi:hypothetical protein